jgi:DNA polymerase III epsilon subunit-like protein
MADSNTSKVVKYIAIDTETGGLGIDKSLLTLGLVFADENLNEVTSSYFEIKPNDGIYRVTGKALEINGINLVEHDKVAMTEKFVGSELYRLLHIHSNGGKNKLIPIGKQMDGDIAQIFDKLIKRDTWEQSVSYRKIDISGIMNFMQHLKLLPDFKGKGSLSDLTEHYGISNSGLHNALEDARMTLRVYQAMVKQLEKINTHRYNGEMEWQYT